MKTCTMYGQRPDQSNACGKAKRIHQKHSAAIRALKVAKERVANAKCEEQKARAEAERAAAAVARMTMAQTPKGQKLLSELCSVYKGISEMHGSVVDVSLPAMRRAVPGTHPFRARRGRGMGPAQERTSK